MLHTTFGNTTTTSPNFNKMKSLDKPSTCYKGPRSTVELSSTGPGIVNMALVTSIQVNQREHATEYHLPDEKLERRYRHIEQPF